MALKARQVAAKSHSATSRTIAIARTESQRIAVIKNVLATAQQDVNALVERERAGEVLSGDVLTFRLGTQH